MSLCVWKAMVCLALAGCGKGAEPTEEAGRPLIARAPHWPLKSAPTAPSTWPQGPAAEGASRSDRERRVADLLRGQIAVTTLPVGALDPEEDTFDPGLNLSLTGDGFYAILPRPGIWLDAPVGTLSTSDVEQSVKDNEQRLRRCYFRGLERDNIMEGTVILHFQIGADGHPQNIDSEGSTLPDPSVLACVRKVTSAFSFKPRSEGYGPVILPLRFRPR
jgi:hypothetical protein